MKYLLALFFLFVIVYSRPVDCTNKVTLLEEDALNAVDCQDTTVCIASCSAFVPGCQIKQAFELNTEGDHYQNQVYKFACLVRGNQEEGDVQKIVKNRIFQWFPQHRVHNYFHTIYNTCLDQKLSCLPFAVLDYVQPLLDVKKQCKKHPNWINDLNNKIEKSYQNHERFAHYRNWRLTPQESMQFHAMRYTLNQDFINFMQTGKEDLCNCDEIDKHVRMTHHIQFQHDWANFRSTYQAQRTYMAQICQQRCR